MSVNFGEVKKYISERGFGFVTHKIFVGQCPEVFFHISAIKKSNPLIAEQLNSEEDGIFFWYEYANTHKGEQLVKVLKSCDINDEILSTLIIRLENLWLDISKNIPQWLNQATIQLLDTENIERLIKKRESLIQKQNEIEKKITDEKRAQEKIEKDARQKILDEKIVQETLKEDEFQQLINEIKPLGFSTSSQVSNYIVINKLGVKYQNISGILEMTKDGTSWNFRGGFPPKIYARLCNELGLGNNGSCAQAGKFTSFKDVNYR